MPNCQAPHCQQIDPLVTPFIDRELSDADRRAVEAHLLACPPCHSRVEAEREVHALIRARVPALKAADAPDALHARCWELARRTPCAVVTASHALKPATPLS